MYIKKYILLLFLPLLISLSIFYPQIPNSQISPGDECSISNSDFSGYRYSENIPYCKRNVSSYLKKSIYEQYNVPVSERGNYTIDHIIPLSIGGSNDVRNLWPEHKQVKATRQNLELCLYEKLRDNYIRQKEAINLILRVKFSQPHDETHPCLNQ